MFALFAVALAQSAVLLPETIVVESRNEQALADASPSISKVQIGTTTAEGLGTLGGVLQSTPGIYTAPTSGEGSQTSLFIRGTNSSQSALLLDGRKLPQGFLNTYEIERYRTFGLSSAEVLRGASSVLYGANAIGGVIDLRLANPLCETSQGKYALTGGSYGRGSFAFHTVSNNGNETKPATQGTAFSFTSSHEDGWRPNSSLDASTALLKSEWQISPSLTVNLIGSADNSEARLPGAETNPKYNDFQNNQGWLISPGLTYYGDNLRATAFWSHALSELESYNEFSFGNVHQNYRLRHDEITAFIDQRLNQELNWGLGTSYDCSHYQIKVLNLDTASSSPWDGTHESLGVWTYADWKATAYDRVKFAIRRDEFTDFKGKTTEEVTYARKLKSELTLHAKLATAYRTPAAGELLYGTVGGLPLRPESNTAIEIGLRYHEAKSPIPDWTLVAFQNQLTDLIDVDPSTWEAYNIAKARTRGIEYGIEGRPINSLRCFGSITYLETEALSTYTTGSGMKVEAGQSLLARPRLNLNVGFEMTWEKNWAWGVSANLLHDRVDYDYNSSVRVDLPDATFIRSWIRYQLSSSYELALRLENLTGESAPPKALGYSAQPRSAYFTFTGRF